jgi:gamma-butyrobetaine dioxygenase
MVVDDGDGPHQPAAPPAPDRAQAPTSFVATDHSPAELPRIRYSALDTDEGMARWLSDLLEYGVVIVTGTPNERGEVVRLAERIGYARPTNFGTIFDVESKPDPNSNAYTALGLELHTDLPFYVQPPDFQFLHALQADAEGGDSTLVDGVWVAEQLRAADPAAFDVLATWPVPFRFHDAVDDLRCDWPVLELVDGQVTGIRFNNAVRDTDWAAAGTDGTRFYDAYLTYWRMIRAHAISVRLAAGDVLCFDNRRVLHGRTEFFPNSGRRHLQGCYVDRDMVRSRLRAVRRQQVQA